MRKRRKLLIAAIVSLMVITLNTGITYAWLTAQKVKATIAGDVYWCDPDTDQLYMAPLVLDDNGSLQFGDDGRPIYDTSALKNKDYAAVRDIWTPVESFAPGELFPDTEAGQPPLVFTFRNVAKYDIFVPLHNIAEIKTLDLRGIPTQPGRTLWEQFRDQPADSFMANPYDLTGVGLNTDGTPAYISDKLLPGYAAQAAAAGGDLILLSNTINPDSIVGWTDAGLDASNGFMYNSAAVGTKSQLFVNVADFYDDALYAIMPGNVLTNLTSVPINISISLDLRTNARYIDNWYAVERRVPGSGAPDWTNEIFYRSNSLTFNDEFTAAQTNTNAIMDIFGVGSSDLMQAYYDDPSRIVSGTNAFTGLPLTVRGDGKFHSFLYLALKYDEPIIGGTNTNLMDPNDVALIVPRGAGSGSASVPAWQNPQLIAKYSNIAGFDAYLSKLAAARAALK